MDNENYDLEKVKPIEERLEDRVLESLVGYQGEDKKDIQRMCAEKKKAREFTETFARNILDQMGASHADIS